MPSLPHEALLLLFRNRPELAPELLRDALHIPLPAYAEARIESAELTEVVPAEYRADLVVLLIDGKPVLGIVVEVQLQRDDRKRFTWPVYVASLRARLECDTCVLVVTPSESVAAWARAPIELGPGSRFEALVVGPNAVPVVRDVEQAVRDPELAVLSAMAHGMDEDASAVALAALAAAAGLDDDRAVLYLDLILLSLGEAARAALEGLMNSGRYEYQSDFAKKHQAYGRAEGKAESVLKVLEARQLAISEHQRQRILNCKDLALLDRWLAQSVSVFSADELSLT